MNSEKVSAAEITYICQSLLAMVCTPQDEQRYRAQIEWLNGELEKLGWSDRRYDLQRMFGGSKEGISLIYCPLSTVFLRKRIVDS